jgi:hypothetical protein
VPALRGTNHTRVVSAQWTADFSEHSSSVYTASGSGAASASNVFGAGRK